MSVGISGIAPIERHCAEGFGFVRLLGPPLLFAAVMCPSGLRSTPRKRVWVKAHRGFKSHRHRHEDASSPERAARFFILDSAGFGRSGGRQPDATAPTVTATRKPVATATGFRRSGDHRIWATRVYTERNVPASMASGNGRVRTSAIARPARVSAT